MNSINTSPNTAENKSALKLLSIVEEFRKHDNEMQANTMALFLHIAAQPDLTIKEYSQRATLEEGGTTTRNLDSLSATRKMRVAGKIELVPGLDLVTTYEDPMDRRFKRVKLTPKGVRVYNSLTQLLAS